MIPINYHHLYYFWTVARSGSIAAATQKLYLSQPALSGQLKQLERSCGATLLERSRNGVSLTHEGRVVFERCERIFSEGDDLAALIRAGFKTPTVLRIGVQPAVAREVVLRLLAFSRRVDASCRITISSGEIETLGARMRQRMIDLIVANQDCRREVGKSGSSRLVCRLPVYFVGNRTVRRAIRKFPSGLAKTAMLLRPPGDPVRLQVDQYLNRHRVDCRIEADSADVDLLRRLAVEGRGVAALSALAIGPDFETGRLVTLHAKALGIVEPVWFIRGDRLRLNPGSRRMVDALMSRFALRC